MPHNVSPDLIQIEKFPSVTKAQIRELETASGSLERLLTLEPLIEKKELFDNPEQDIPTDTIPDAYKEIIAARIQEITQRVGEEKAQPLIRSVIKDIINPFRVNKLGLILTNTAQVLKLLEMKVKNTLEGELPALKEKIKTIRTSLGITGSGADIKTVDVSVELVRQIFAIGHLAYFILQNHFENVPIDQNRLEDFLCIVFPPEQVNS